MEKGKYLHTVRMTRKRMTRKHVTRKWKAPVYRKAYLRRYGTRCFLRAPAYPICTQGKIDCKGVHAAAYYVRLNQARSNEGPNEGPNERQKLSRKLIQLKQYCKHLKKASRIR